MAISQDRLISGIDQRWEGYQGLFGGFVAGLLVDTAIRASSFRMVSFAANFVSGVALDDFRVTMEQVHRGRSTELLRLSLIQGERVCMHGMAELVQDTGVRRLGLPWVRSVGPSSPPMEWIDQGRFTLPFDDLFEVRRSEPPSIHEVTSTWVRVRPDLGSAPSLESPEALITVLMDLPTPGLFGESDPPAFIPTIEYSLHFPPRHAWTGAQWLRLDHSTAWATSGDCADDVTAWAEDGALVALARQTRSVRWPRT